MVGRRIQPGLRSAGRRSTRRIGFVLPMSVGAMLMSLSTVVVALNAQLLRRLDLRPGGERSRDPPLRPMSDLGCCSGGSPSSVLVRASEPADHVAIHVLHEPQFQVVHPDRCRRMCHLLEPVGLQRLGEGDGEHQRHV